MFYTVSDFKNYSLANTGMMRWAVVVKDEIYNRYQTEDNIFRIKGYITDNNKDSEGLTNELANLLTEHLPAAEEEFLDSKFLL